MRLLLPTAVAFLLLSARPVEATWSIVLANPNTGEVAVGSATCLSNFNLRTLLPVIRVGVGAAATQAQINFAATNKKVIFDQLPMGASPAQILQMLIASDPQVQTRQFGIVNMNDQAVTFSGSQNAQWAGGVTGSTGGIRYAIQGNILTGAPVVAMAEAALINTSGDMPTKLMAAMEAARAMGGDGRCSCAPANPTGCGSPPPSFNKSAHIGFVIVARVGDVEGVCNSSLGCATGNYYLVLNVKGNQLSNPDPVVQMQQQFVNWKASKVGRPDQILSVVKPSRAVLPNDGASNGLIRVELIDRTGVPLTTGGAVITASREPGSDDVVSLGTPIDLGNGTYEVPYVAKTNVGKDVVRLVVDDGQGPVTLFPFTELATAKPDFLVANTTQVSAAQGDDVGLSIQGGAGLAGRFYYTLMSLSGTSPGLDIDGVTVPLVPDSAFVASFQLCGTTLLPNTCGVLDGDGKALAGLVVGAGDLAPLVSATLSFATVIVDPIDFASAPVSVTIVP